jgi:hypothetical protein
MKNVAELRYSIEAIETGTTGDETWDAMQKYLIETGELHNNARMTWGKTMLHWLRIDHPLAAVLYTMVHINDRYALDGLSPPSYAGLLWCFGWCDKPANGQGAISEKPAYRYRQGPCGFDVAKQALSEMKSDLQGTIDLDMMQQQTPSKKQKTSTEPISTNASKNRSKTPESKSKVQMCIDSFFKVTG